jgi:hypothetical protein
MAFLLLNALGLIDHDSARVECLQLIAPMLRDLQIPQETCEDVVTKKLHYYHHRVLVAALLNYQISPQPQGLERVVDIVAGNG